MPQRLSQERNVSNVLYEPLEINHCNDDPDENFNILYDITPKGVITSYTKDNKNYVCREGQQPVGYTIPISKKSNSGLYAQPISPQDNFDPYQVPIPILGPSYAIAPGSSNSGYAAAPGSSNSSRYAKIQGGKSMKRSTLKRARATRKGTKKNNKKRLTRSKKNKNKSKKKNKRRFTRK